VNAIAKTIAKLKAEMTYPLPMEVVRNVLDALFDEQYTVDAHSSHPEHEITINVHATITDGKLTVKDRCPLCGEKKLTLNTA